MTTLGELLVRLQDRAELEEILAQSGDILALSRLDNLAMEMGSNACDAALEAVQSFTARADDEAWVKLIGRLQDAHQPAGACLSEIIAWSLRK